VAVLQHVWVGSPEVRPALLNDFVSTHADRGRYFYRGTFVVYGIKKWLTIGWTFYLESNDFNTDGFNRMLILILGLRQSNLVGQKSKPVSAGDCIMRFSISSRNSPLRLFTV
jgi:hypothetical protein